MKKITIKDLQNLTKAEIINKDFLKQRRIAGICTDSRVVKSDDLFFAIKGAKFDAHDFIEEVIAVKPAAIVVNKEWAQINETHLQQYQSSFIIVPNSTIAFGELARIYRRKFDIPVIAIGGSNGKTTTKEMVCSVLCTKYEVLYTEGNLNNHIGVPQTIFRLTPKHHVAVIELGTNHFGELKYLCDIVEPTHGLITNIGKEHLEFFGDEDGVAREEKELFRYLQKNNGFAFINNDDKYLVKENKLLKRYFTYGVTSTADIRAKKIEVNELGQTRFNISWGKKNISFAAKLFLPGMHNVINALAASAIGLKLRVKPKNIAEALRKFSPASKRMEVLSHNGIIILNDTYNSNPDSVLVALQTLKSFVTSGKKIVVLGDMRELGDASKREHTNIGVIASEMKFDKLYTFGPFSKYTYEAFGHSTAKHFDIKEELSLELKNNLQTGDVVLIKGSRGMKMEEVVQQITNSNGQLKIKEIH